jgi:hypothetical protein
MSCHAPWLAFSGGIIDDKAGFDIQAGRLGERSKLLVGKDVPSRCAAHFVNISLDSPGDYDIAIGVFPPQVIAQKAKGGWNRAVVAYIVPMKHVDEDPPVGRHETRKVTENLQAGGCGKDVSEDIPETSDDVKPRFEQMKFFGAHRPELGVLALHRRAGLHQNQFRNVTGLCDATRSSAVTGADIEHGAASRRYARDHKLIDAVQVRSAFFGDPREHRADAVVCGDWV